MIITGIYRSGTTLIQKLLDANPRVSVVNHGMAGFFQMMKPYLFERAGVKNSDAPLGFHWIEPDSEIASLFTGANFDQSQIEDLLNRVKREIGEDRSRAGNVSHPTYDWLDELKNTLRPGTAAEVLDQQIAAVADYKKSSGVEITGFKELHLEQFVEPMLADNPDLKVIQIIRDPRAVLASRNFSKSFLETRGAGAKHPIRLISSVWTTGIRYKRYLEKAFPESFLSVKYESLVRSPESQTQDICKFLGVDWDPVMLDVSSFRSEVGKTWEPNSSFGKLDGFDQSAIEKWRNMLPDREHAVMEYLCGELLNEEGYESTFDHEHQMAEFNEYNEDPSELVQWSRQPLLRIHP
jgi:hypothetical protein